MATGNLKYLQDRAVELNEKRDNALQIKDAAGKAYDLNPSDENLRQYEYARKRYAVICESYSRAKRKLDKVMFGLNID